MSSLINRKLLSPKDLATAIGASESSLKRWTDQGLLEITRTAGGHRRIAVAEAIRFVRAHGYPLVNPEILGLPMSLGREIELQSTNEGRADNVFSELLRTGHDLGARNHIFARFLGGETIAQLVDGPIREAMGSLGELWEDNPEAIFLEHRATEISSQLLSDLRNFVQPEKPIARALGGAIGGDPFKLAPLAVSATLSECGIQTVNLGPDTPIEVLEVASLGDIIEERPQIVWISVSSVPDPDAAGEAVRRFAERCADAAILLLVGGRECHRLQISEARGVVCHQSLQCLAKEIPLRFPPVSG